MLISCSRLAVAIPAFLALGFAEVPEVGPLPKPRPDRAVVDDRPAGADIRPVMSGAEAQCLVKLAEAGVAFKRLDETVAKGECGIDHPLKVTSLAGGISLSPPGLLNCSATLALANWVSVSVVPAAKKILRSDVKTLRVFATYVCRTRNSVAGAKLSEHSKGNAVDVGRFILSDGRTIDVRKPPVTAFSEKKFLGFVRKDACGPFKTVLGPGSDAHHSDHFHLDIAARRNGGLYCK